MTRRRHDIAPLMGELIEERPACSLLELAALSGVPAETLVEYVEIGLIEPVSGRGARDWRFAGSAVMRLKRAERLAQDFLLEPEALALVLDLLDEIDDLRRRLRRLQGEADIL